MAEQLAQSRKEVEALKLRLYVCLLCFRDRTATTRLTPNSYSPTAAIAVQGDGRNIEGFSQSSSAILHTGLHGHPHLQSACSRP
jgi:hypothetical protein